MTEKPHDDLVDHVVGNYRIIKRLGSGGSATVYRAEAEDGAAPVAMKISRPGLLARRTSTARFLREAQAIRRTEHPGCVKILDWGIHDDRAFIVMELVDGQDLSELLAKGERLPQERAVAIAIKVCDVLEAAHEVGVVHRDLKPRNIKLLPRDEHGEAVKLVDFGLAKIFRVKDDEEGEDEEERTDVETLTGPLAVLGTPKYMAPEQMTRRWDVDHRADIYALGVVLYQMVTGQVPFTSKEAFDALLSSTRAAPSPPSALVDIDEGLDALVMRCIESNPAERFQTAAELGDALAHVAQRLESLGDEVEEVPTKVEPTRVYRRPRRAPIADEMTTRDVPQLRSLAKLHQDPDEDPTRTRTTRVLRRSGSGEPDSVDIEISLLEETEKLPPDQVFDDAPPPSPKQWQTTALIVALVVVVALLFWRLAAG